MDDNSEETSHLITEGGIAASHPPREALSVLAGPATENQANALQPRILPIACFRLEDVRFDFDSSMLLVDVRKEMPLFKKLLDRHSQSSKVEEGKQVLPPMTIFGHADPAGSD